MRRVAEISTDCYAVPWGSAGEGHPIPRGRRGAETRRADQGDTQLCRPLAERLDSQVSKLNLLVSVKKIRWETTGTPINARRKRENRNAVS